MSGPFDATQIESLNRKLVYENDTVELELMSSQGSDVHHQLDNNVILRGNGKFKIIAEDVMNEIEVEYEVVENVYGNVFSIYDKDKVIRWVSEKTNYILIGGKSILVYEIVNGEQRFMPGQKKTPPVKLSFYDFSEIEKLTNILDSKLKGHLDDTDQSALQSYFQYYGKMSNQMNMLQDTIRTKSYRDAIHANPSDFIRARVMDVGAGSGILSCFSAQCKAHTVYVVEASSAASAARTLFESNKQLGSRIKLLPKTVETIDIEKDLDGEKVDVLVSEPIGTFLFNERMIESYLFARDHFLKPGGAMYPNRCKLYIAPFTDHQLFTDMSVRAASFWNNQNFFGLNLTSVLERAVDEQFRQPIVDTIDPAAIVCQQWHQEDFDLRTISRASLNDMTFNFRFVITTPCLVHGLASWFDVIFEGTDSESGFSTAPWCPQTHWQQIRFVFRQPLAVNPNQTITGSLRMIANTQQSYYITAIATLEDVHITTATTDPDYRYYTYPQNSYVPSTPGLSSNDTITNNSNVHK